jgi:RND superfamily putative drug exporter
VGVEAEAAARRAAVVVGLSALLLLAVFRSVLIPLKAALLNVLTIPASLGVITLVFGDSGPIEAFIPVMIFAIVFGLSMDYEVFLVSRMHEDWMRTRDASRAISVVLAILLDAFVIRCLIVPAVRQLIGERAWWLPRWPGRRLPRVALEGGR